MHRVELSSGSCYYGYDVRCTVDPCTKSLHTLHIIVAIQDYCIRFNFSFIIHPTASVSGHELQCQQHPLAGKNSLYREPVHSLAKKAATIHSIVPTHIMYRSPAAASTMSRPVCRVVQLLLTAGLLASTSVAGAGLFTEDFFNADMSLVIKTKNRKAFYEPVGPVPTGVAWDGHNFWTAAGGSNDTANLLKWCTKGTCVQEFDVPHLDLRSIWTQGEGKDMKLYADVLGDDHVYVHTDHGHFELTNVTLHGASKDIDSPVLYRQATLAEDPEYGVLVAHDESGSLLEFNAATGAFLRAVPLKEYGSEPGETDWPNYVRFAVAQVDAERFVYLTYAGGHLHAWDHEGARVGSAILEDVADDPMSCHSLRSSYASSSPNPGWDAEEVHGLDCKAMQAEETEMISHSLSYARDRVWVRDTASQAWHGYKLNFAAAPIKPQDDLSYDDAFELEAEDVKRSLDVQVCAMAS